MARQLPHVPSGSGVGPFSQFRPIASTFAVLVFPVPRGPENRYAWETRSVSIARRNVRTTGSCPTIVLKARGRHFR